jgi:hypothetical protein
VACHGLIDTVPGARNQQLVATAGIRISINVIANGIICDLAT